MYASGEMAKLIAKWGGDPQKFLTPSPDMAAARRGVDRPDNWEPPTI
jgi:polar amino acid transport system substrate-binding protein